MADRVQHLASSPIPGTLQLAAGGYLNDAILLHVVELQVVADDASHTSRFLMSNDLTVCPPTMLPTRFATIGCRAVGTGHDISVFSRCKAPNCRRPHA